MVTGIDKAIVAVLGGVVTLLANFGVTMPENTQALITAVAPVLTALAVYFTPNKA
jgi:hypothetical protein